MNSVLQGGCACAAVRYICVGKSHAGIHCQCRACQKSSGTGHTSNLLLDAYLFDLCGTVTYWRSTSDSGNQVDRGFCSVCGTPIMTKSSGFPDFVFVRAATLDDPNLFCPTMITHGKTTTEWDAIDPGLPYFSGDTEFVRTTDD